MKKKEVLLCTWCRSKPRKEGYALCARCLMNNNLDAVHMNPESHFICPVCLVDIGSRLVCSYCGVVRYSLMSLPSHCSICHCQFWYHKYNDTKTERYCWCCGNKFKESDIDDYIMIALNSKKNSD